MTAPDPAATSSMPTRALRASGRAGRRSAAALRRGLVALFSVGGRGFRDLAVSHAASVGGDTLVAIALAGTLFFGVPSAEARGNVALYLLLTLAPFAIIGPALGLLLDRFPSAYGVGLVVSAGSRIVVAVVLIGAVDSLWLFPLAFGLLVFSRAHGISKNALLPVALDAPLALVAANARLAQVGLLASAVVAPAGIGLQRVAPGTGPLLLAAAAFLVAAIAGGRVPSPVPGRRRQVGSLQLRLALPRPVRLAQLATAGVRLLNGFLLVLLAFAFRDTDAGLLDLGAVLAAAGAGYALASMVSPFLEARLREEPMVVAALAIEAAAAFSAGQWFGVPAAAALAAAAGFAWGTAKLAFDGLLQATITEERRGLAFTRAETLFQLSWVVGAVIPTVLPVPAGLGLAAAGFAALGAQVVYVGALLIPPAPPRRDRPVGQP